MNFGFVVAALALMIVAFVVARTDEEITANMPRSPAHVAAFRAGKNRRIRFAHHPIPGPARSTTVAALGGGPGGALQTSMP